MLRIPKFLSFYISQQSKHDSNRRAKLSYVTDIPEVKFEDEVVLLGEGYTADDMAQDAGTIGYEVVCDISKRVPRVYQKS